MEIVNSFELMLDEPTDVAMGDGAAASSSSGMPKVDHGFFAARKEQCERDLFPVWLVLKTNTVPPCSFR